MLDNKTESTTKTHSPNFTCIFSEKYHNVFHVTEKESNLVYFKDLELHTIELKKFSSDPEKLSDILLAMYMYVI